MKAPPKNHPHCISLSLNPKKPLHAAFLLAIQPSDMTALHGLAYQGMHGECGGP